MQEYVPIVTSIAKKAGQILNEYQSKYQINHKSE
jgi:hypothetical protein